MGYLNCHPLPTVEVRGDLLPGKSLLVVDRLPYVLETHRLVTCVESIEAGGDPDELAYALADRMWEWETGRLAGGVCLKTLAVALVYLAETGELDRLAA